MKGRDFFFLLLLPALLGACASGKTLLPFVPLFPASASIAWPQAVEKDPVPLPPAAASPAESEQARAWIDLLRGKNLIDSSPIMDRITQMGMSAFAELTAASEDQDADIRFKSTILLGELRDVQAAEFLTRRLGDPSEEVAMMAARGLSLIQEPWVAPRLFQVFAGTARHPSLRVRVEAARAAAKLGFPQAIPFLLTVLKENTRLADPFGGFKDWDWSERWAWEKWVAGETMKEITGLDPKFDANQGVPQMEESIQVWIDWWKQEGSQRRLPASIQNDIRFQKIAAQLKEVAESDEGRAGYFCKWLIQEFGVE